MEQYELRELHFHALMRTKEGDVQLSLARAEDQRKRAEAETTKARTLSAQVSTFSQTETELRSQLNIYVEKFKQVGLPSLSALVSSSLHHYYLMFCELCNVPLSITLLLRSLGLALVVDSNHCIPSRGLCRSFYTY